jgi:NADH-quinone oxidoreductase subunit A
LEKLGYFGLIEMFFFIFILLIGLIYAIRKDVLKWES